LKKRRSWSLVLIIASLIILTVVCVFYLHKENTSKVAYKPNLITIKSMPDLTESGKVYAKKVQQLKIPDGTISQINIKNGQSVIKNDIVLTTHDEKAESQLSSIEQKIQRNNGSKCTNFHEI